MAWEEAEKELLTYTREDAYNKVRESVYRLWLVVGISICSYYYLAGFPKS